MPDRLSYTQFAAKHGLVTDYDVQGHIHGGLMAAHMPNSYHRRYKARLIELQAAREDGVRKYQAAIQAGEVEPWPELTRLEALESAASGDPDRPSTQAARRLLERYRAPHPSAPATTSQEQAAPSASDQRGPQHDQ